MRAVPKGQASGRQPGMPVMAMHHLGTPSAIQTVGQVRRAPTQCSKTPVVVGVSVLLRVVVGVARPVIQVRRNQYISLQRLPCSTQSRPMPQNHLDALAPRGGEIADGLRVMQGITNRREARQQGPNIATLCAQRRGQGACHIGQAAGFEQGE